MLYLKVLHLWKLLEREYKNHEPFTSLPVSTLSIPLPSNLSHSPFSPQQNPPSPVYLALMSGTVVTRNFLFLLWACSLSSMSTPRRLPRRLQTTSITRRILFSKSVVLSIMSQYGCPTQACVCVCVFVHACVCTCVCACVCACVCVCVCMCACVCVCVCVCTCACVCVRVYVCMCVCA